MYVILRDFDLNFQGQTFKVATLTSKRSKTQTLILPSGRKSGIFPPTVNVERHNLDLNFQGHEFSNVNISITVK